MAGSIGTDVKSHVKSHQDNFKKLEKDKELPSKSTMTVGNIISLRKIC